MYFFSGGSTIKKNKDYDDDSYIQK